MGDSEQKRRRYCLMCNVFKPERCHHCSTCNRCVLNMDHHCPWVNNCIGFWNRKPFLLLIGYTLITLYFYLVSMGYTIYRCIVYMIGLHIHYIDWELLLVNIYLIALYIFLGFLAIMISVFFKFHLTLVIKNITTLESLEKKGVNFDSPFDVGKLSNWEQVFGKNPALWFFPIHCASGKPMGNGVNWYQKVQNEIKMMNYNDYTQDETAEYEIKKSTSLAKSGTIVSQQQHVDIRHSNITKPPHEADYHENIKHNRVPPKRAAGKSKDVESSNKVEVSELNETKKTIFKQRDTKLIVQH